MGKNEDEKKEWGTEGAMGAGHRGERAPGFPAELYRLSLGGLHTAQSPSTKKRWPTGWQSHCMASGTEPLCARQAWRALLRKKRCGKTELGCHTGPQQGLKPRPWSPPHDQVPHPVQPLTQGATSHSCKDKP